MVEKKLPNSSKELRRWIEPDHPSLSIRRQCELVGLPRSSWHYQPIGETPENLQLMRAIDEQYLRTPFFGSRQMTNWLKRQGEQVNRKRIQRLMRQMGLEGIAPSSRTTRRNPEHRIDPYLLRDRKIERVNQVWSTDITYVPMRSGYMYLAAIMDWYSRFVISWRISNTLDIGFCLESLEEALERGTPEIFNSDQGSQFTSRMFTSRLEERGIAISMDGRGRALDNVFVERLWRTVKYEDIYLREYATGWELQEGPDAYFSFYCHQRPHSSLNYQTPEEVYYGKI